MVGIVSCNVTGDIQEDWVVVPEDFVKEGTNLYPGPGQEGAILDLEVLEQRGQLPELVLEQVEQRGLSNKVALVKRKNVKLEADQSKVINLNFVVTFTDEEGNTQVDEVGTAQTILGTAASLFPQFAPVITLGSLALGAFGGPRSRKLLIKGAKKLTPMDGTIDITGAAKDFAKAMGWKHTSDTPEELRARADRLEAETKAREKQKKVEVLHG